MILRYKFCLFMLIGFAFVLSRCNFENNSNELFEKEISSDSLRKINKIRRDSIILASQKLIKEGKKINLLSFFGNVLSTDTTNIDDYINYAYILSVEGKADLGIKYLNKALLLDNINSSIFFAKGITWSYLESKKKKRDSLYYYLGKAIEYDSLSPYYWTARSMFYDEDSLYFEAIRDINKAIKLDPKDTSLYLKRGSYKISIGDFEGAIDDMKNISVNYKSDYSVYANRAYCYLKLSKYKECIEQASISLSLNPNFAKAYGVRAAAKSKLNNYDGAYDDLERGARLGDKECEIYLEKYKEVLMKNKEV